MPILNTNFVRVGESLSERGTMDGQMNASVTFAGPSDERWNFIDRIFGTRELDTLVAPSTPIPYNSVGGSYIEPGQSALVPLPALWPDSWTVRELTGSGPLPMERLGSAVLSDCPVLVTVNYRRRRRQGYQCDALDTAATATDPYSWAETEQPHFAPGVVPDNNRGWTFSDGQPGQVKRDSSIGEVFIGGTWTITWRNTQSVDLVTMFNAIQTINLQPLCGFPVKSLMYKGPEVTRHLIGPNNQSFNVHHSFLISVANIDGLMTGLWGKVASDFPVGNSHWRDVQDANGNPPYASVNPLLYMFKAAP